MCKECWSGVRRCKCKCTGIGYGELCPSCNHWHKERPKVYDQIRLSASKYEQKRLNVGGS
jgi:hypothetical protein